MASDVNRTGNLLGALVLGLGDQLRDATEAAAGQTAATPAALVALQEFAAGESIDYIRNLVGLTPSGGVRLVDRLEADGLVERRVGADARSREVVLTAAGRRLAKRVRTARADVLADALAGLTAAERTTFTALTEKLLASVVASRLAARAEGATPSGGATCRMCDPGVCGRADGRCPVANAAALVYGPIT